MAAPAFTKFDPRTFLENEERKEMPANSAKIANPEKREERASATLATFATLAGGQAESENFKPLADTWTDAQDERAAVIQHDGGAPREWAEALARLNPAKPPADVPAKRWLQFIDDCGWFLDGGWAGHAAALGWRPLDLFGCDRNKPFARLDRQGLLWLVNGGKLIAFSETTAAIETATGARLTYYRVPAPVQAGAVLAWQLIDV
jgi:hypothetical protein